MQTAESIAASVPARLQAWKDSYAAWSSALDNVAHAQEAGAPRGLMERLRVLEEEKRQARNRAYWDYSRAMRGFEPIGA